MELIKTKYKSTEVGLIPEDWSVDLLENLTDVIDPHPSHRAPAESSFGVPFLGIGDFDEKGNIIAKSPRIVGDYVLLEHQKRYNLNDELIGLGRVASIGKVVSLRNDVGDYTISPTLGVIRSKSIDANYLKHVLKSVYIKNYFTKIMSGSTRSSVGMIVLRKIPIPYPTLHEQKAIATALSDVDALISSLEKLITKKKAIKQGAMQELLTPPHKGGKRLPGFSGDWEENLLEELTDVIDPHPSHRAPAETNSGVPFLGIGDLDERGNIIAKKPRIVGDYVLDEHRKRYDVNEKLIGLGRVASIGKVVTLRNDVGQYTISPTLGVLRCKSINVDFLRFVLNWAYIKGYFTKIMSGSTRSSVGMIVLRQIPIPHPCIQEQEAIAQILSDMNLEIEALEAKKAKYQGIKQGMMQELLTGKTRLV